MTRPHTALNELLAAIPGAVLLQGDAGRPVLGIGHDSRRIEPGELFVAVQGGSHDARRFVADAVARGAVGVVVERPVAVPPEVALVLVPSARAALADLASALHGHPSSRLSLVGVTGTDGKTTTTHLIHAILRQAGRRVGRLSTVDISTGDAARHNELGHTTPEAPRVQELLAQMVDDGCDAAVLEVSSHALALDRVRGCAFDAAVFTNLTPEHLDFHGTMADYVADKARLFGMLGEPGPGRAGRRRFGVLNADDPASAVMRRHCAQRVITFGIANPADVTARDVRLSARGARFVLVTPHGEQAVVTPMIGRMNVANWLAATATALELGATLEDVRAAAEVTTIDGRMQRVDCGQPYDVVVDFAHTPQALETALRTLRAQTRGRLIVMFGHAGGRDAGNRPALGSLAVRLADLVVITSDNPHPEDPEAIAAQLVAGALVAGARLGTDLLVQLDRASALDLALDRARPGDTVLLAGKGHERHQVLRGGTVPWNDRREAYRALRQRGLVTSAAS